MKEITMHLKVEVVHHEEGFTALCPQLPGCITEGATEEEARINALDAIQVYLETVEETQGAEGINRILQRMGAKTFDVDVTFPLAAHG